MERIISKITIAATMERVWILSKLAIFQKVGLNLFLLLFETHADKQRVEGGDRGFFIIYFL